MSFQLDIAEIGLSSGYNALLVPLANQYGVDPNLVRAIISVESEWNPSAVNPADPSYGLMQILLGAGGPYPGVSADQLLDPATNLTLGISFLASLVARYGSTSDAISAYNAGRPRTLTGGGYANQTYVNNVQTYWAWFANNPAIVGDGGAVPTTGTTTDDWLTSDVSAGGAVGVAILIGVAIAVIGSRR